MTVKSLNPLTDVDMYLLERNEMKHQLNGTSWVHHCGCMKVNKKTYRSVSINKSARQN